MSREEESRPALRARKEIDPKKATDELKVMFPSGGLSSIEKAIKKGKSEDQIITMLKNAKNLGFLGRKYTKLNEPMRELQARERIESLIKEERIRSTGGTGAGVGSGDLHARREARHAERTSGGAGFGAAEVPSRDHALALRHIAEEGAAERPARTTSSPPPSPTGLGGFRTPTSFDRS